MKETAGELTDLKKQWRRWTALIERNRRSTPWLTPKAAADYTALYANFRELLTEAQQETTGERRVFLDKMDELSLPWMSLDAVRTAEKHILADVARRSQRLHVKIFGEQPFYRRSAFFGGALALAGTAAILWGFVIPALTSTLPAGASWRALWRSQWYRTVQAAERMSQIELLAVLVILIVFFGVFFLRSTRQY